MILNLNLESNCSYLQIQMLMRVTSRFHQVHPTECNNIQCANNTFLQRWEVIKSVLVTFWSLICGLNSRLWLIQHSNWIYVNAIMFSRFSSNSANHSYNLYHTGTEKSNKGTFDVKYRWNVIVFDGPSTRHHPIYLVCGTRFLDDGSW